MNPKILSISGSDWLLNALANHLSARNISWMESMLVF